MAQWAKALALQAGNSSLSPRAHTEIGRPHFCVCVGGGGCSLSVNETVYQKENTVANSVILLRNSQNTLSYTYKNVSKSKRKVARSQLEELKRTDQTKPAENTHVWPCVALTECQHHSQVPEFTSGPYLSEAAFLHHVLPNMTPDSSFRQQATTSSLFKFLITSVFL